MLDSSLISERLGDQPQSRRLDKALGRVLDPSLDRPRLRADVEIVDFRTRWGEHYAIAHRSGSGTYLRLTGDEAQLARRLDGTQSLGEIALDQLGEGIDLENLAELVAILREQAFLTRPPMDAYATVSERLLPLHRRVAARAWRWMRKQTISLPHVDAYVDVVYRFGGRWCFSLPANAIGVGVLLAGFAAFVALARRGTFTLAGEVSTPMAASLFGLILLALFVHEFGHALAVRHAGRRIVNAGFQLYLGHPAFFVDSSDLLLAPPRARVTNALAGPYVELVVAGGVALAIWFAPSGAAAPLLFRFVGITYLGVLINLIPFVELDGYWLLSDLAQVPRLRQRALVVLRHELPDRLLRRRHPLSRSEWALAAFGVGGVVFTVAALVTAWVFWGPIVRGLALGLWGAGAGGRVVLVLLFGLIAGPLAHAGGGAVRSAMRAARSRLSDLRFRAQRSWRVAAAEAVATLPLTAALDDDMLSDLAGRVVRRRVSEGEAVVRQDEPADAFYLVRRGRFAVVERDEAGGERLLRRVGPGGSFGELAFLEHRPRTATVRAQSDGELFAIDAGTFQRVLAPVMTKPELVPAMRPILEVWALKPFRHLGQHEAGLLAERGEWLVLEPDELVVRQGEEADAFYVLAAGQAEVLRDGVRQAVLRAGDHFGEIGLLDEVPRTASVRTLSHTRLFRIDGDAFRAFVAAGFRRQEARAPGSREVTEER